MNRTMIETLIDDGDRCGEGPIWDSSARRLLWTDIPADVVYELGPRGKRVVHRGTNVSTIALARDGGLIFGGAGGLWKWTKEAGARSIISHHVSETLAINDMIADPRGRIYAGTAYWGAAGREKFGKLYLIDKHGAKVVEDDIELANGLGFSVDGNTLYFADSVLRKIWAYDVRPESGDLTRKRVFAQMKRDDGLPDGLTVDANDHVWVAMWYGGKVMRFDPDGKLERIIETPAIQTSSLAFGGDLLDDLYITSAAEPWPSDLAPKAYKPDAKQGGALYRLKPGVAGKKEYLADF
jgi:D-xylonolactonase